MTLATTAPTISAAATRSEGAAGGTSLEEDLPVGLTHPYRARVRTAAFVYDHTFTWTPGDQWIAIQEGRVANANQRCLVIDDPFPQIPMQLGRRPVIAWVEAPKGEWWHDPVAVATKLKAAARHWVASGRHTLCRPSPR